MSSPRLAIIGAGSVGGGLGARLARSGHEVYFGLRAGKEASELLAKSGGTAHARLPEEAAAAADIVFITVPGRVAVEVAKGLPLDGKIVVDCANPLAMDDLGPKWVPPPEGSLAQAIQAAQPQARVIKAFNTFGAEFHADPRVGMGSVDVQMASDDDEAKATLSEVIRKAGFHPLDVGPLRNAACLENLAILWIHRAYRLGAGRQWAFQAVARD